MMTQGDTIYDITDKRDHATAQAQLLHGSYTAGSDGEQVFFCRMNVSRSFRRQTGYGDHKVRPPLTGSAPLGGVSSIDNIPEILQEIPMQIIFLLVDVGALQSIGE